MKKYLKEIIALIIQLSIFYFFPLSMYLFEPIGMVMMMLLITFILSILLGVISKNKIKFVFPIINSIVFIPSVFIYYNESALIHSLWYFVISITGLLIGGIIKFIIKKYNYSRR